MDDVLTRVDSLEAVRELQIQLIRLLARAGMEIHKWRTNASNLQSNISEKNEYSFPSSSETKALGILIAAIQELIKKEQWFHVSSEKNLADVLSRGLAPEKSYNNERWWTGPSFLQAEFPVPMSTPNSTGDVYLKELKTSKPIFLTLNVKEKELFIDCLLSATNSYLKLIRVVSFIFRFIFNSGNPHSPRSGPLTGDELKVASEYLIKEVHVR
ncbi:hypothetical protein AVEN_273441-1 [Araneus ventricosus]|uniref:Uncharacterized protein n=1 Tax=Araneus ventricosus TaxID=182803 RepID=A0A4Y2E1P6_ARAVE|nr:hypothetical protein AVEN_273441-1 [Araneus ventricosus]